MVSTLYKNITPSATISLNNKFSQLKSQGKSVISFAAGEPEPTTPIEVIEYAFKMAQAGKTHYTPSAGIPELRSKIAKKYSDMTSKEILPSQVIVSIAKFAINIAVGSVIEPGDEVLLQDPSFLSYPEIVKLFGGKPVYVNSNDDGSLDIEDLKEKISPKTKMLFLNSPANPQGWVATHEELKALADISVDKKIYVMSDEIYEDIVYEGKHESILQFPGMEDLTFVVNGFSKSHAMTGWRIGYIISPKSFSPYLDAYQQHTITCAPSISQYAALKAMDDRVFPQKLKESFQEKRNKIYQILSKSEKLKLNIPRGTFYIFPKLLNGMDGNKFSNDLLEKKGVLVTPGEPFGPSSRFNFRISYALSMEELIEGGNRILEYLG
jgi:aspartate aminotransferase